MSLSIGLLTTLAALLPGLLFVVTSYLYFGTPEVRVTPPPLRSTLVIAIAGAMSVLINSLYAGLLELHDAIPMRVIDLPVLDPYLLVKSAGSTISNTDIYSSFGGFVMLCLIGIVLGRITALGDIEKRDEFLYGWLAPLIRSSKPDNAWINAYALTTNQRDSDFLGYEGTLANLVLDEDRNVIGATLRNVETFYVRMNRDGARRVAGKAGIDMLVLRKDDFQNMALEVIVDADAKDLSGVKSRDSREPADDANGPGV